MRKYKEQPELKNIITEMKNTLEGIHSRLNKAEEWISELEDRMGEITAVEQDKERKKNEKKEGQFKRSLGQHSTHQHLHYRGPRRRKERERA